MERKFGRDGRLKSVHDHLVRLGAEVGISFAFDKIKRAPNALDAHRLIRWAGSSGTQREVVDRLFRAYFVEGRDVGDRAVLLDVAAASGLATRTSSKSCWPTARTPTRCGARSPRRRRSASPACRSSFSPAASACPARRTLLSCAAQ